MALNTKKIRKDFPILKTKVNKKPLIYFDNAATSQKPEQVIDAISNYYTNNNANIHRSVHELAIRATDEYEQAHKTASSFINAKFEELIFTKNDTEAINLLAYSLSNQIKKNDEIVITAMDHHSNFVPWQQIAKKRGAELKILDINDEGLITEDELNNKITKKTKIVSVPYISNVLGTLNNIKQITKAAHQNNALTIIDAAQAAPHMPIDVKNLNVDFLVFTGHKMLGPTGIGALYGKKEHLESMDPFLYGGEMIADVKNTSSTWNTLPWKFEAGTANMAGAVGLKAAIDYLNKIGMHNIKKYDKEITDYTYDKLSDLENVEIYGPDMNHRVSLISFNIKGANAHDVATLLNSDGIAVRDGHHCAIPLTKKLNISSSVRASLYLYNTKEEVDTFIDSLKKISKVLT